MNKEHKEFIMKRSIHTLVALLLLGGIGTAAFADGNASSWRKERQEIRKEKQEQVQDRRAFRQEMRRDRQCARQERRLHRQKLRRDRREFRAEQRARWHRFHDRKYAKYHGKSKCHRDGRRHHPYGRPMATLSIGR
jgi:hypothetical protein